MKDFIRLKNSINSITVAIVLINDKNRIISNNKAVETLFQIQKKSLINMPINTFLPKLDIDDIRKYFKLSKKNIIKRNMIYYSEDKTLKVGLNINISALFSSKKKIYRGTGYLQ